MLDKESKGPKMNNDVDIFYRVYRETADDYFRRLGGAGRYDRYCDWHALALAIVVGLRTVPGINEDALRRGLSVLPRQLTQGCDNLAGSIEAEFLKYGKLLAGQERKYTCEGVWNLWSKMKAGQKGFLIDEFDALLYQALLSEGAECEQ
jgi:hypothetical protein